MHADAAPAAGAVPPPDLTGLDYDFLRYIGGDPAGLRRIQEFYLPFFTHCRQVLDLGCGEGDFLELLRGQGIEPLGVDSDDKVYAAAAAKGLPVVHQDVFAYLRRAPDASVDGIFCAHLVEHLPYPLVVELVHHAYRLLRPGGRLVMATPDTRTLYAHLENFYLHFGHVSFYHPRLLCFFMEHAGFVQTEFGANPKTETPLAIQMAELAERPRYAAGREAPPQPFRRLLPEQGGSLPARLSRRAKNWLAAWVVLPIVDSLAAGLSRRADVVDRRLAAIDTHLATLDGRLVEVVQTLQQLNGPYECYATAIKPESQP